MPFLTAFISYGSPGRSSREAFCGSIEWPPDFCVRLREQFFHRHVHKSRIGIVFISIGHAQLHNFGDGVDVVRREQAHFLEIKSFKQA